MAELDQQRRDQRRGAAHRGLGGLDRHAVALHDAVVFLPAFAEACVLVGVHHLEVDARLQPQAGALDARGDHARAAHQDRPGHAFGQHRLHRTQHPLVLALGVDDTRRVALGRGEDRAHEHAGLVDIAGQRVAVGVQVGDRALGDTRLDRGRGHRRRDAQDQARVEGLRDQVLGAELQVLAGIGGRDLVAGLLLGQRGDLAHAGQLHRLGDLRGAAVQRAAEDVGKAQDVVDLVRIVRAAGGDDAVGPRRLGDLGADLRLGVGQRQDDRLVGHRRDHVGGQHAGGRAAQEDVGVAHHVGQRLRVGLLAVALLGLVQAVAAAFADHALGVADEDVLDLHAQTDHQVQAGDRRRAGTRHRHLHFADLLADQLQAVEQRRARDDRGAVLVIVEDRNAHALAQLLLDVEALGRLDVLEVDAAQRRLQRGDDLDQLVRIALGQLDVEDVDAGELLEEAALALHHRLGRQRADVAQAQHRGAVGDHGHQVAARSELAGAGGILDDRLAGIGHARRIGQRQVALGQHRLGRRDLDLAGRGQPVVFQRGLLEIVVRHCGNGACGEGGGAAILTGPRRGRFSRMRRCITYDVTVHRLRRSNGGG